MNATKQPTKATPADPDEFNAGDPEQVRKREQQSRAKEDVRREGLRFLMSDRRGRAYMRHLLAEKLFTRVGKTRPAAIFTGNSTTFYNSALKELGDTVATELANITPDEFRLMENEGDA